jgi:CheY-like chemotaxis protein
MVDSQKLILMIQPSRLQGLIWQAVLKSQSISVIQETTDTDIVSSIRQLHEAGLTLPDALLIDINQIGFNPYSFCRWCRDQNLKTHVVLTNSTQAEVSLPERQWAMNQGAADLLAGFQVENLVSSVATATKRLLEVLDYEEFDNGALIAVLLKIKREIEARRLKEMDAPPANSMMADAAIAPNGNGFLPPNTAPIPPNSGNGYGNGDGAYPPAPPAPPPPAPAPPPATNPNPPGKRRYRGISY